MRTVIILAIGIYLGRQLYINYEKERQRAELKPRLVAMLTQNGVARKDAEKQVCDVLKS